MAAVGFSFFCFPLKRDQFVSIIQARASVTTAISYKNAIAVYVILILLARQGNCFTEKRAQSMGQEIRTVCYDGDLKIEAYRFQGVMLRFPNHFHDYYVIGFTENGRRSLRCAGQEHIVNPGDIVLFNPMDTHTCEQVDGRALDYRCINIMPDIMKKAVLEITGTERLPRFTPNVLYHSELVPCLRELHLMIFEEEKDLKKEELFLLLIEQLLEDYSDAGAAPSLPEPSAEIRAVCEYLEQNYATPVTLDALSALTSLSKYHLLRSFTRQKGISPYCYLETVRISKAKKLLEQGAAPMEAALSTGFSDQSHFTTFFKRLIGPTPKQYRSIFHNGTQGKSSPTE